jgi:TonB family protein
MRYWFQSTAKGYALGPSATISFVAHVALIGAAIRSTEISARELVESIAQRIQYLPPPDRRGGKVSAVERLQYVDIGGGTPVPVVGAGDLAPQVGPRPTPKPGGEAGADRTTQEKSVIDPSPDSVYSVLEVEQQAVRSATSAAPAYPAELMKAGTEGRVFIRFVVDTSGHADSTTLEIVRATNPLFAESVRAAVPQMNFTPATVAGRRVRQTVEQNFEFRITPPAPAPVEQTRTKRAP